MTYLRNNNFDNIRFGDIKFNVRDEQPLLPTFKKKRGRKPKYTSVEEGRRIANRMYLAALRDKGLHRMELRVTSDLAAKIRNVATDKGIKGQELAIDILEKVLAGETVSLEHILASEPQPEIAQNSST